MTSQDLYRCHWCAALGDALTWSWCACAGDRRSLVCSRCSRCMCNEPSEVEREFWSNASPDLLARREEHGDPVGSEPADLKRSGSVILIVDDDRLVHAIVGRIMVGFEGTVLHAHTGTEALRIARQVRPDLILTDALLPGVDGRELSKAVKTDPVLRGTTVVVMTALYKGARYRQEAFTEYFVDGYVEKPLGAMKLRSTIEDALHLHMAAGFTNQSQTALQEVGC